MKGLDLARLSLAGDLSGGARVVKWSRSAADAASACAKAPDVPCGEPMVIG